MTTPAEPKLDYKVLTEIVDCDKHHHFEVSADEVAPLRDLSKGISIGDTIAFVAVTEFLLADDNPLKRLPNCGHKTVLMYIDKHGAVKSDLKGIDFDPKSAARWIAEHFHFEFKANGSERSQFLQSDRTVVVDNHTTFLPWIQEVDTSGLRGSSLDVEVTVTPKAPPQTRTKSKVVLRKDGGLVVKFDNATALLKLKVEGNYQDPEKLEANSYWLTLHSDSKPDLRIAVEVIEVELRGEVAGPTATPSGKPPKKQIAAGGSDQTT